MLDTFENYKIPNRYPTRPRFPCYLREFQICGTLQSRGSKNYPLVAVRLKIVEQLGIMSGANMIGTRTINNVRDMIKLPSCSGEKGSRGGYTRINLSA